MLTNVNFMNRSDTTATNYLKILGTAGARFVVAHQLRSSAGTYIHWKGTQLILDPGPGTLVRCAKSRPPIDVEKLDAVILTHSHIDHSTDVNVLLDAMTSGGLKKRGALFAPRDCLEGENAVVLSYLHQCVEKITVLEARQDYHWQDIRFTTSPRHDHPVETYGIIFDFEGRKVSFLVDTQYFPELLDSYRHSEILILNVVRFKPHPSGEVKHLCVDDVKTILNELRPQKAILTHFGMTMLRARPHEVAQQLSRETGVPVVAASDGMTVALDSIS